MKKILVVEDDETLNAGLVFDLELENYQVEGVYTIKEAFARVLANSYDLCILDGNLPDGTGFMLCKKIKEIRDIPVIFLTARNLEDDEIRGFDVGAEDYITKPFSIQLFRKRVAAVLRRSEQKSSPTLYNDGYLMILFDTMEAVKNGETLVLTPNEYKFLRFLTANPGRVLTRQLLLEKLWDNDGNFVDEHALTVTVGRLRSKIEDGDHQYIKTVYGMGYQWLGQ